MKLLDKFLDFIIKHYKLLVSVVALMSVVCAVLIVYQIKIDNSLKIWFLEDDPVYSEYLDFQEKYGNDDIVSVFVSYPHTVWDDKALNEVMDAQKKIESLDYVDKVYTFTSSDYLFVSDDEIRIVKIADSLPANDSAMKAVAKRFRSFPVLKNTFLTDDETGHIIIIRLKSLTEIEEKRDIIVRDLKTKINEVYSNYNMGGIAVLNEALNERVAKETTIFSTLSYLVIIVLLSLYIRKRRFLLIAIPAVLVPIVLLFGIFVIAGHKLNVISMIIPSIMMVYCIADAVHILNIYTYYGENNETMPKAELVKKALRYSFLPCLFTSLTTMAGYISFSASPLHALKETGIFAFLGVGIAFVVLYILCAAGLMMLKVPKEEKEWGLASPFGKLNDLTINFLKHVTSKSKVTIITSFLIMFVVGIGMIILVEVNTYPIEYLSKDELVRKDSETIEKKLNAYLPFEIIIRSLDGEKLITAKKLMAIEKFQSALAGTGYVFSPSSLADVVKYLNKQLSGKSENYRIPDSDDDIEQALLIYEMDENNKLAEMTDVAYSELRMTGKVKMLSSQDYDSIIKRVASLFVEIVGEDHKMELIPQGYTPLYVKLIDYTVRSQVFSFVGALLLIIVALFICFRKLKIVFFSIVVNIIPLSAIAIFMVVLQIPLDMGTAMVAAIMLGIALDDTIHFMHAYLNQRKAGVGIEESVNSSMNITGRALISTSITLTAGFLIIAMSSVKSLHNYGVLSAMTVVIALLADLLLLPALLKIKKK